MDHTAVLIPCAEWIKAENISKENRRYISTLNHDENSLWPWQSHLTSLGFDCLCGLVQEEIVMVTDLGPQRYQKDFATTRSESQYTNLGDNPVPKLNHRYQMVKVPRKWLQFTDHWLKWQSVHVIALSFPGPRTPIPMQPPHVVRYEHGFARRELQAIRHTFLPHAHRPVHSFTLSFFSASCFRRTSFLLLEGDPTSWLLTCRGADFLGYSSSSITSNISLFLCTNSSNRGYLRHHLFGTSTGRLPLFLHFSEKKSLL